VHSFASRLRSQRAGGTPVPDLRQPLAVIGAGFGRTGTMSLKIALETLGLKPCYHMTEMVKNPTHPALWAAAGRGEPVDWAALFDRYRATVDWPGSLYYRELMVAYPAAKVILTVRDADTWYDSVANTLYSLKTATDSQRAARGGREPVLYANRIWDALFGGRFADREHTIEVYRRHNAEVARTVPADRLLVYQVSEGWPPLCEFLDLPVPPGPFPRVNDTQAFRDYNRARLGPA
jgi:hypothetical protein